MAREVIGSTLASIVKAVEWAEYIKFLREEIVGRRNSMEIVVCTDCKSVEAALKSAGGMENRMQRSELAQIKEKIDKRVVKVVKWIDSKEQLPDSLTKRNSNKSAIIEEVKGLGVKKEEERERIISFCYRQLIYMLKFSDILVNKLLTKKIIFIN